MYKYQILLVNIFIWVLSQLPYKFDDLFISILIIKEYCYNYYLVIKSSEMNY